MVTFVSDDCPTECIVADFFTKPLQGEKHCQFRDIITGVTTDDYNPQEHAGKTQFGFLSKKTNENYDMNRVLNNISHDLNMILKIMRSIVIHIWMMIMVFFFQGIELKGMRMLEAFNLWTDRYGYWSTLWTQLTI